MGFNQTLFPQAERPDVLALLNKVTMARQKTEELQQQRNYHPPLAMSSPETTAALSPLSHAEVELLRHIRVCPSHFLRGGLIRPDHEVPIKGSFNL